jgi:hypothetical protein
VIKTVAKVFTTVFTISVLIFKACAMSAIKRIVISYINRSAAYLAVFARHIALGVITQTTVAFASLAKYVLTVLTSAVSAFKRLMITHLKRHITSLAELYGRRLAG